MKNMNQNQKNQTEKKTPYETEMEAKLVALEKEHPEMFNALKAKAAKEVGKTAGRTYEPKQNLDISVNRFGDLHLKKIHLVSAEELAGITQESKDKSVSGTPLKMRFEPGKIILEVAELVKSPEKKA